MYELMNKKEREDIQKILDSQDKKRLVEEYDIRLFEKRDHDSDMQERIGCREYLFPRPDGLPWRGLPFDKNDVEIEYGEKRLGDYVVYLDEKNNFSHLGKLVEGEYALSKWGYSDVYMHRIEHVPSSLGSKAIFVRKKQQ